MGADIHGYIEYTRKEQQTFKTYWDSFGGEINLYRNYPMFGYLTNGVVRYGLLNFETISPRGLPEIEMSYEVEEACLYRIVENPEGPNEINNQRIDEYVNKNCRLRYHDINKPHTPTHIEKEYLHSHSYLYYEELKKIVEKISENEDVRVDIEYHAILAVMKVLLDGGFFTRFVFWFDS